MNGAEVLVDTLENNGVEVCFSNPGTSEVHLVAAMNKSDRLRPVLALFEGVVAGAADGYGRMAGKPACTLLHLGPGLGNGLANLHNAKRGGAPIVNIVGDHPAYHLQYDSPLTTDIASIATSVSDTVRTVSSIRSAGADMARAIQEAKQHNGQVVTLILPANVAWEEGALPASILPVLKTPLVDEKIIVMVLEGLKKKAKKALLLRGDALKGEGLRAAGRIAKATGARLLSDTFSPRMERGAGYPIVERVPYRSEDIWRFLSEFELLVLVGSLPPVAFFAYPGKPSWPIPEHCRLMTLAHAHEDITDALQMLDKILGIPQNAPSSVTALALPALPADGPLHPENIMQIIGHLLPEKAIICDESISSGFCHYHLTANARPHDYLQITGGAIGSMLSASIGAAIACPERKVMCLVGDGSAMYTIQALWTMARERLDIIVLVYANHKYAILQEEMKRMGVKDGQEKWPSVLDIGNPVINWVKLAESMGVEGARVKTANQLAKILQAAIKNKGPILIEAVI